MDASFVVLLAVALLVLAVLGIGVVALLALLRMKRTMDPADSQER